MRSSSTRLAVLERRRGRPRQAERRARRPAARAAAQRRVQQDPSRHAAGASTDRPQLRGRRDGSRRRRHSTRPTASPKVRRPSAARWRRTSSARCSRYASTCAGVAANLERSSGRCVAIPTGQVSRWHERTIRQPSASSSAVPNETSSAPSSAAATTSLPVFSPRRRAGGRGPQALRRRASAASRRGRAPRAAPAFLIEESGLGAGAAVAAGDVDDVGQRLDHARRDEPDAGLGDELHRDGGGRIDLLEVEDELRQILDRVDVVMRRRRDQPDTGLGVPQSRDLGGDLVAGQLAALAGLGALGDLDLELVGVRCVLGRDAEASRCDLLDPGVALVAEARGILAALAAVRAPAEPVERDRDRLVGLGGERPVRHAAAREAAQDRLDRLDLVERHGRACRDELEQVARLERRATVDERGEAAVLLGAAAAVDRPAERVRGRHRLQRLDHLGRRRVRLAAGPVLDVAGALELAARPSDARPQLAFELGEADPAERRRRAGEAELDDLRREPSASKSCAPRYEATSAMPIFAITLRTPSSSAARKRRCASPGDGWSPPRRSAAASAATVSSASRGQMASAP